MSKLLTRIRNSMPSKEFALPEKREFPIEDKAHAANAKSRATQSYDKGNITKVEEDRVHRAANRKLHGVKEYELEHWGE